MSNDMNEGIFDRIGQAIETLREARHVLARAEGTPVIVRAGDKAARVRYQRDCRTKLFEKSWFGEPAWDILLDLFVAQERGTRMSTKAASSTDGIPTTTGLRWLSVLEEHGLICRVRDEDDRRRDWIVLTDRADDLMRRWLDQF